MTKMKVSKTEEWIVIDATQKVIGRLATEVATKLMEKDLPTFAPNKDSKSRHIIVINAAKIVTTPKKLESKMYYRHSRYLGNLKSATLKEVMEKDARKVLQMAVKGMLPKNRMQRERMKRLHVYVDEKHPHPQVTSKA